MTLQLTDGLVRTKNEADLSANDSGTLPQVSSMAGRVLRWWTDWKHTLLLSDL